MSLATAIAYLTVFRLPGGPDLELRGAVPWFPVVGAFLGALLALAWTGLSRWFPPSVAAMICVMLWIALTGGIHLDGLARSIDALFSWRSRERMHEILRDPHAGSLGTLAMLAILLAKVVALQQLDAREGAIALMCAPIFGRSAQVLATIRLPCAREEGVAASAFRGMHRGLRLFAAVLPLLLVTQLGWLRSLVITVGFVLLMWFWFRRVRRLLGGMTGATLGAINEIVEAWVLAGATLILIASD